MKILWRLIKEAKRYKGLLILAMCSTLALTGVNLVAPKLLSGMIGVVEAGVEQEDLAVIGWMTLAVLGAYLLRVLFRFLANDCAHRAAWHLVEELRIQVYNRIQSFSMGYYHDKQTGELMARVMNDTSTFEQLYAHLIPETVTNVIMFIGVTTVLLTVNWKLALLTCIPIPFILIAGRLFATKVRPNFRKMQKSSGELSAQLQDNFSGIQEIQVFGQQRSATRRVREKAHMLTDAMLHALHLNAIFHPTVEFITSLGTVIVVGFGGLLAYSEALSVSDIIQFMLYLSLFYAPLTSLANLLEAAQQALAGAERVIEILDTPQTIVDLPGAHDIQGCKGHIRFEDVAFRYLENVPLLKDISFEAKPGQMIALVGATGVGKTTLTQLAARFYDPTQGRVLLDGQDLRELTLASVHQNVSMVLQDTFLFNATIAQNIAFSRPDATREEIRHAAEIARIHDDIMAMPEGYETQVGERGTKLSGGQKQRLAIARAVLCRAPVLILDEATASVDVQTEARIQQAIGELSGQRTIIAIAHRLSTIRNADLILVFDKGQIVQRGTHAQLIAQDGLYRRMCEVQEAGAQI